MKSSWYNALNVVDAYGHCQQCFCQYNLTKEKEMLLKYNEFHSEKKISSNIKLLWISSQLSSLKALSQTTRDNIVPWSLMP